jgi:hypothetical protein
LQTKKFRFTSPCFATRFPATEGSEEIRKLESQSMEETEENAKGREREQRMEGESKLDAFNSI